MTLDEMRAAVRHDLQDNTKPYRWGDDFLTRAINEAETEACRRARLITDSTSALTRVSFRIGDPACKLDPRIMFVRRLKIVGETRPLPKTNVRELDCEFSGWEDDTGWPSAWLNDKQQGYLHLDRIPEEAIEARLIVNRVPLKAMAEADDQPEIAARFHESLLHWVRYRAYLHPDAETFDKGAAADALALFEQEFGKRSTAQDEAWIASNHDFGQQPGAY